MLLTTFEPTYQTVKSKGTMFLNKSVYAKPEKKSAGSTTFDEGRFLWLCVLFIIEDIKDESSKYEIGQNLSFWSIDEEATNAPSWEISRASTERPWCPT